MTARRTQRMGRGTKVFLAAVISGVIAAPVMFGLAEGPHNSLESQTQNTAAFGPELKYDVASVRPSKTSNARLLDRNTPDGFVRGEVTVMDLFEEAYRSGPPLRRDQVLGAPSWFYSYRYSVSAKMSDSVVDAIQRLAPDQRRLALQVMLQRLLADRFNLRVHREAHEFPVFMLTASKGGPKLKQAKADETYTFDLNGKTQSRRGVVIALQPGLAEFHEVPISRLIVYLERHLDRNVEDRTELTGDYDFTLHYAPTEAEIEQMEGPSSGVNSPGEGASRMPALTPSAPTGLPPISKALEEQLGLKLEAGKGPVTVFVIDHIERPSAN